MISAAGKVVSAAGKVVSALGKTISAPGKTISAGWEMISRGRKTISAGRKRIATALKTICAVRDVSSAELDLFLSTNAVSFAPKVADRVAILPVSVTHGFSQVFENHELGRNR